MQRRSWMAALTLAALAGAPARADEPTLVKQANEPAPIGGLSKPASVKREVTLMLRVSGVVRPGGSLTVKPANASCRFKPFTLPITGNKLFPMPPLDIETFSADRDCSLVITLKEPGQPDKTMRRNFRVDAVEPATAAPQVFDCYVSAMPKPAVATVADKAADAPTAKK